MLPLRLGRGGQVSDLSFNGVRLVKKLVTVIAVKVPLDYGFSAQDWENNRERRHNL